eukprot:2162387-Rhodomonas_salina.1
MWHFRFDFEIEAQCRRTDARESTDQGRRLAAAGLKAVVRQQRERANHAKAICTGPVCLFKI